MQRIWLLLAILASAVARQEPRVTYVAAETTVGDAVAAIAAQAGLAYDAKKSADQADVRRVLDHVRIEAVPFAAAMRQILEPAGLGYAMENGQVVLYRASAFLPPGAVPIVPVPENTRNRKITYSSGTRTVQYIVYDLARLVGLGYAFDQSLAQTDPACRKYVYNLSIKNQPFDQAMKKLLGRYGLRYTVENGNVVLYRR